MQVLRDLPLIWLVTLSYVIAATRAVDLGYPVKSGLCLLAAPPGDQD